MSKASEMLFASQPTISLQIKTLEKELGVNLFERRGPKLKLTTEGEILYDIVNPLVTGIDHLKDSFGAQVSDLTSGELTIAAEESTILYTLPGPISQFVNQYPGIRLKLTNVTGRDSRELLMADDIDLAVSSLLNTPNDIDYHPFVSYPPVLITPKNHPLSKLENVSLADIGQYGMILPPSEFSSWRLVKMVFALNGTSFKVTLEAGGWEVVKKYVSMNLGISIVTEICINDMDRERLEIIPLTGAFPTRTYGIMTRKGKIISKPAKRFIELLIEHYSQAEVA